MEKETFEAIKSNLKKEQEKLRAKKPLVFMPI